MPRSVPRTRDPRPVPLSPSDYLTLACLGTFIAALLAGLAFGTPPEIHP